MWLSDTGACYLRLRLYRFRGKGRGLESPQAGPEDACSASCSLAAARSGDDATGSLRRSRPRRQLRRCANAKWSVAASARMTTLRVTCAWPAARSWRQPGGPDS
jgi:hypothetical protein